MRKPYTEFFSLLPGNPLQTGLVLAATGGEGGVQLAGGRQIVFQGASTVGKPVCVRAGAVEGRSLRL